MLVSIRHRLVLFAMPKCASTAFEAAIGERMDVVIRGHPGAKHTNVRKFELHLRRYLEGFSGGTLETVCLFREPIDWLHSWWRYRGREAIPDPTRSSRAMSFDSFVQAYLDGAGGPADLGRQSRFVSRQDGSIGIDRLFRYDRAERCARYLGERLGTHVDLDRLNVSPPAHGADRLAPATVARAASELARDFEIYETVAS